jgi:hypothetical protein
MLYGISIITYVTYGKNHSKLGYLIRRRMGLMAKVAEADATLYCSNMSQKGPFNASGQPDGAKVAREALPPCDISLNMTMIQANSEPSDGVAHTPLIYI